MADLDMDDAAQVTRWPVAKAAAWHKRKCEHGTVVFRHQLDIAFCDHPECYEKRLQSFRLMPIPKARPLADYHEDMGPVLWWQFPVAEEPYVGTPGDSDWPSYHTHFTTFPVPDPPEVSRG